MRRLLALLALIVLATDGPASVQRQLEGMGPGAWFAVVYLALAATLLAYSLWTRLLQRHAATRVMPFSLLVPVVGLQWLGMVAVLLGLVVNQVRGRRAALFSGSRFRAGAGSPRW
ncbi:EamA family transporter [Hydrogenophaga sp. YM1]|uniref:EamA family transporter n=1 Tax=Hydrogenophaga sp. YM1 TaxID=2806262 RepID=UPI001EF588E3|nr:EamA family transporter [Hydrogenophaga sp. YM1]